MAARLLSLSRSIFSLPSPTGFRYLYTQPQPLKFTISCVVTHDGPFPPKREDSPSKRSAPSTESDGESKRGTSDAVPFTMAGIVISYLFTIFFKVYLLLFFCAALRYFVQNFNAIANRVMETKLKCEICSQGFHTAAHLKRHYRDAHDITAEGKKVCRCGCCFRRVKDRIVHSRTRCPLRAKEGINGLKWRMIKEYLDTEPKWMRKKGI